MPARLTVARSLSRGLSRRACLCAIGAGAAALGVAGWQWRRNADPLQAMQRAGLVRIGYAVEAPYALVEGDRVTGACPETARLVAAQLGCQTEWVQTDFATLISDLRDHRFDLVSSGLFVSAARATVVRFAAPELQVSSGLLVRRNAPRSPRSYADLRSPRDSRAAAIAGSMEAQRLHEMDVDVLTVPDARVGATAVALGSADVLVLSWPSVQELATRYPSLQAIRIPDAGAPSLVAAAFRLEDGSLVTAWNRAQAAVLGTPPHLRAIAGFVFGPTDLPPPTAPARGAT